MTRWIPIALVLSLALNVGFGLAWFGQQRAQGSAYPRHMMGRGGNGGGSPLFRHHAEGEWAQRRAHRLHRELGLDPQRRDQLRDSLEPLGPEIADARRDLFLARRGFAEALHVDDPDREAVMRLRTEVSRLQAQLDSLVAEALLRESTILDLDERMRSGPWSHHPEEKPLRKERRR